MMQSSYSAPHCALFQLGFRPFFLVAALFSLLSMGLWMLDLVVDIDLLPATISPTLWHAHAMIYGYALAVIAGFLLTAVRNWTGIPTLQGRALLGLVAVWLVARLAPWLSEPIGLWLSMAADTVFMVWLAIALTLPIVQAKRWKNLLLISIIYGLLVGSLLYDLGISGRMESGARLGIYVGFYLILALILLLAGRVMPMFTRNGVDHPFVPRHYRWATVGAVVLFPLFVVSDLFAMPSVAVALLAVGLAVVHAARLSGWYTTEIWSKPLLWVLFVAYGWIIIGFIIKAVSAFGFCSPLLALHAFAVGGIAMMTLGMMARVAWGHSGRNLQQPPSGLTAIFLLLAISAVVRVLLPMLFPAGYTWWIALSQLLWLAAFMGFLWRYAPVLWQPRPDGGPG